MIHVCKSSCQTQSGEQGALLSPFKMSAVVEKKKTSGWRSHSHRVCYPSLAGCKASAGFCALTWESVRLWLGVGSGGVCGSV